jgi:hypothetical protein
MVRKTMISFLLLTYILRANAQTKFIYGEAGLNNCSVLSFESQRLLSISNTKSSVYYKPQKSYHLSAGLQNNKYDLGLVFKAMSFDKLQRYYIGSNLDSTPHYKRESGNGIFYSLAPNFGYTIFKKNKYDVKGFIEFGIPLHTKLSSIKQIFNNDSIAYNNTLLVYAFDFRTGIVFNRKLSRNLDLSCAAYYLYMGHHNYEQFEGQPERLWGIGGGFLGMNMAVRYKFHYKKE